MAESDTNQKVAALALEQGYCEAADVDAGVAEVERLRDLGIEKSLADVLRERGHLTEAQREKLIAIAQPNPLARLLPGYEILGPVGKGGMGVVYKARHLGLDKLVAVKVLPPKFANDPQFVDRFLREARAAGRLNHENIVHAIDAGVQKGYYYYIMEFVEGETAKQRLRRDGVLSESAAVELLREMGEALAHIHRHDLIHRDVKPENIIYDVDGTAKLCDLGLARVASEDASPGSKMATFGTPLYISPEQILTPHQLDGRCDIYSLGATVYHLVANTPPYYGDTKAETVAGHLSPDPPPLVTTHNPQLSNGFADVLARMLTKDRDQRYVSAEALLADLADLRAGRRPGRASGGAVGVPLWVGATALALGAAAAAWVLWGSGESGDGPTTTDITPSPSVASVAPTVTPTPGPTPVPAPVPESPGARSFLQLRETAQKASIPTVELCDQLDALIAAHPSAAWTPEAETLSTQLRRSREVAAAEALRAALSAPTSAPLAEAAARYPETVAGRAAGQAAAFREAVAADGVIGQVAEAAKSEAAGDRERADALLDVVLKAGHPAATGPLGRLREARLAADTRRRQDAGGLAEAIYHRDVGEAWTLAGQHRFAAARDLAASLADAIAEPAVRAAVTNADLADFERLAALGATVRAVLAEWVAATKTVTLRTTGGRARGPLITMAGRFHVQDAARGPVQADLPDLPPAELMRIAFERLSADAPATLTAQGVLFFLGGQFAEAKQSFDQAGSRGASRHRFRDAIAGKELGDEEDQARANLALARQELLDEEFVSARTGLAVLLRDKRFRATDVIRRTGDAVRTNLGIAISRSIASYGEPLRAVAAAVESTRAADLAASHALVRAVQASNFSGARAAVDRLLLIRHARENTRMGAVLAHALEHAKPGVLQPWLPDAWRKLVGGDVPTNAVGAWMALINLEAR